MPDTDLLSPRARRYTGGLDLRHRFFDKRYEVAANLSGSSVNGTADAIASTQIDGVHRYQRPDDDVAVRSDAHVAYR